MLSTLLELAGFGAFAYASFLLGGTVTVLIVAGVELLILGLAADADARAVVSLSRGQRAKRK